MASADQVINMEICALRQIIADKDQEIERLRQEDARLSYELKYQAMRAVVGSRHGHHGAKTTGVPPAALEGHHDVDFAASSPDFAEDAFDSYYLSAFAYTGPSLALLAAPSTTRRPRRPLVVT